MDVESTSAVALLVAVTLMVVLAATTETLLAVLVGQQNGGYDQSAGYDKRLSQILASENRLRDTVPLLRSLSYVLGGGAVLLLVGQDGDALMGPILALAVTWFWLTLAYAGGRRFASKYRERTIRFLGPLVAVMAVVFGPLSRVVQWVNIRIPSGEVESGPAPLYLEEYRPLGIEEHGSHIEEEEQEMIASIYKLADTTVREIMVPRLDIAAIELDRPLQEALDLILEKGYSRIPVYKFSVDQIVGFLYAKDILRWFGEGKDDFSVRDLVRTAYFVPQSKKLNELFQDMQLRQVHLAVVVDEYGGTAGLVTIEDLLEEIVGEIQDEYDAEEPVYQQLGTNAYVFNARIDLEEVAGLLDIDLQEEQDYVDTLGGFVYRSLGRVPRQGEIIEHAGHRFTVLSVDSQRIEQVRVERLSPDVISLDTTHSVGTAVQSEKSPTGEPSLGYTGR